MTLFKLGENLNITEYLIAYRQVIDSEGKPLIGKFYENSNEGLAMFYRELLISAELKKMHVCRLHQSFAKDRINLFECSSGQTLQHFIDFEKSKSSYSLVYTKVLVLIKQICQAMYNVHDKKFIHAGIEPKNFVFYNRNDIHSLQMMGLHNAMPKKQSVKIDEKLMSILHDDFEFNQSMTIRSLVFNKSKFYK